MIINNICCIGAGYVGGPTMAVIALKCPEINVTIVDKDQNKIDRWNGPFDNLPVYEPGLAEIVEKTRDKNLFFSSDIDLAIQKAEIIFMAVNTPTKKYGKGAGMAADLSHIEACAKRIARVSKNDKIVVEKSTLPVRTAEKIKEILKRESNGISFEVISNPEFLAEGTAINDLFKSDRVLIGGEQTLSGIKAVKSLVSIYEKWIPKEKILETNVWSSELSKLASNAMLAQRISSINSLSALCEKTGADIDELSKAIGMDRRIGSDFLKTSVGFGGSCFKKDILNLVYICKSYGLDEVADYWHQVYHINNYQKNRFARQIIDLKKKRNISSVAILGWAFKKNTNDSRESASINVTKILLNDNLKVFIYDPMVSRNNIINDLKNINSETNIENEIIDSNVFIENSLLDAIEKVDVAAILTEWDEFTKFDWKNYLDNTDKNLNIFDGRNIIDIEHKNIFKLGK